MNDGIYKAKVINYGITTTKAGDPQVTINMKLLVNAEKGETVDMMWNGSLKEGRAQEITCDALLVLGYTENNFGPLVEGKGLPADKYVQVTVESETYNGKTTPKIKWINELGSSSNKEFLAKNDAVMKLAGLNIEASLMARKQAKGLAPSPTENQTGYDAKNIPF